jgi:phosphoribosyl-AMP cyclohydrolase
VLENTVQDTVENLSRIRWDEHGLVPVIAQDHETGKVLMFAWMNREALQKTMELKRAVYFSRSRRKLWFKGEESGHIQQVKSLRMDCDQDVLLLGIEQVGHIACHTGRNSCFFEVFNFHTQAWEVHEPVLKNPNEIYGNPDHACTETGGDTQI